MKIQNSNIKIKILSAALAAALSVTPDMWAQQPPGAQPQTAQPAQTTQPQQNPPATQAPPAGAQQPGGTTVNPSQPPLAPAPVTTYPGGQPAQTTTVPEAPKPKQQPQQPVGAATAEKVPTAGQAAAKPAGAAIAPAQQHQTRSLLIKLGAVAAAGVAIGTVFALSKGSPSKPPGAP